MIKGNKEFKSQKLPINTMITILFFLSFIIQDGKLSRAFEMRKRHIGTEPCSGASFSKQDKIV